MASFSPSHRDAAAGGATLYLHSPNTLHHVHSASAINQLRRSLSKSPSKPVHARPANGANEDPSRRTTHGTGHGKLFLLHPTTTSTSNHSNNISSSSTPSSSCPCQGDTTAPTTTTRAHKSARAGSGSTSTLRRTASMQLFKVRNGLTLNSPNPTTTATATTPATAPPQRHSRRVLSESRSQGNAGRVNGGGAGKKGVQLGDARRSNGQQQQQALSSSSVSSSSPSLHSSSSSPPANENEHTDATHPSKHAHAHFTTSSSSTPIAIPRPSSHASSSSHLKRTDEAMHPHPFTQPNENTNTTRSSSSDDDDETDLNSPSPKRRSIEAPPSTGSAYLSRSVPSCARDEFPQGQQRNGIEPPFTFAVPACPNPAVSGGGGMGMSVPKRGSSLRKSTLLQRPVQSMQQTQTQVREPVFERGDDEEEEEEKEGMDRSHAAGHARTVSRSRSRTCSGSAAAMPPPPVFHLTSAGQGHQQQQQQRQGERQRERERIRPRPRPASYHQARTGGLGTSHPLSRTITQSSEEEGEEEEEGESLGENGTSNANTNADANANTSRPPPTLDFSKSLPPGALRPSASIASLAPEPQQQPDITSADPTFATPINYRLVKPLPAAFLSTGLISKKNKTPADFAGAALAGRGNMPDTPCKRPVFPFPGAAAEAPTSAVVGGGDATELAPGNGNGNGSLRTRTRAGAGRSALGASVMCAGSSRGSTPASGRSNGNEQATKTTTPHPGPFSRGAGVGIFGGSFMKARSRGRIPSADVDVDVDAEIDADADIDADGEEYAIAQGSPSARFGGGCGAAMGVGAGATVNAGANGVSGLGLGRMMALDAELPPTPTKPAGVPGGNGAGTEMRQAAASRAGNAWRRRNGLKAAARTGNSAVAMGANKSFSCSSPSSPTSGETATDSEYESGEDSDVPISASASASVSATASISADADEDGDTVMDDSPSLLALHSRLDGPHHHAGDHEQNLQKLNSSSRHSEYSSQDSPSLPFSLSSRLPRHRFLLEATRSPSPQEKKKAVAPGTGAQGKCLPFSFTFTPRPFPSVVTGEGWRSAPVEGRGERQAVRRQHAHERTTSLSLPASASPLEGRNVSLFGGQVEEQGQGSQNQSQTQAQPLSTPQTPLENSGLPFAAFGHSNSNSNSNPGSSTKQQQQQFRDSLLSGGIPATPTGPSDFGASAHAGVFAGAAETSPFGNGGGVPAASANAMGIGLAGDMLDVNALKRISLQRQQQIENIEVDACLLDRFDRVELIGSGEFSTVFSAVVAEGAEGEVGQGRGKRRSGRVSPRRQRRAGLWAVKKSKHPFTGVRDRERRVKEVEVLKALKGSDHVIAYEDSWEDNGHLYIQTEFCSDGSLDVFLAQAGLKARLDDFRIWKILLELAHGLKHIHDSGFIHLDLKPANVLISAHGVLKIADFGLATPWPAARGIDGEGDREYIGPEILMGRYDKPADVFALGLIVFETAGNVELPDNGPAWQKLRNGDLSDIQSLTWLGDASGTVLRDARGNPIAEAEDDLFASPRKHGAGNVSGRPGELQSPPDFMVDPGHESSLDSVVRWMIDPCPEERPSAAQVLEILGVRWVERRRRAGATVYEGNWGPAAAVKAAGAGAEDEEMIDVW